MVAALNVQEPLPETYRVPSLLLTAMCVRRA